MNKSGLLVLVCLLAVTSCQNQWNTTQWVQWPYPMVQTTLGYCAQARPAPNQQYCAKCLPGLIQYSNQWFFPCQLPNYIDYCISSDWHLNCLLCTKGYYVKYGGHIHGMNACWSKRIGCAEYDQVNKNCKTCMSSYSMNTTLNFFNIPENYCIFKPDPNCVSYDSIDNNTCLSCVTGYVLNSNKCVVLINIPNCEIVTNNLCTKCNIGYQKTQMGTCFLIPRVVNCDIQQFSVCKKCLTNYELDLNGQCVPIAKIIDCEIQIDYTCTKCILGLNLQNNQCKFVIANCLQIVNRKCNKCSTLYMINNIGTCSSAPKIPNCADQNGIQCLSCLPNYNMNNGLCEYFIQNCLTMSGLTCAACFDGFVFSNEQCIARTIIYDLNCRRYDQVSLIGKCLQCSQGYILNDTKCLQVDPLCKTYDLKTGFCLTCYPGYKLNSLNEKCVLAPPDQSALINCNQFDYIKNVCIKCADGSSFDSAKKCQKSTDANCKTPSADFMSCAQCYNGYYHDNQLKKCIISKNNCLTFNSQGTCATCPNGYILDSISSICNFTDQYCKTTNILTKKCSQCYEGYGLNANSICQDVNTLPQELKKYFINCAKFDKNGSCSRCYFRWFLSKDTNGTFCQPVSDSCRNYHPKTGFCITCYLGYYNVNGTCQRYL